MKFRQMKMVQAKNQPCLMFFFIIKKRIKSCKRLNLYVFVSFNV